MKELDRIVLEIDQEIVKNYKKRVLNWLKTEGSPIFEQSNNNVIRFLALKGACIKIIAKEEIRDVVLSQLWCSPINLDF